jgi:hypothetical protein
MEPRSCGLGVCLQGTKHFIVYRLGLLPPSLFIKVRWTLGLGLCHNKYFLFLLSAQLLRKTPCTFFLRLRIWRSLEPGPETSIDQATHKNRPQVDSYRKRQHEKSTVLCLILIHSFKGFSETFVVFSKPYNSKISKTHFCPKYPSPSRLHELQVRCYRCTGNRALQKFAFVCGNSGRF